MLLKRFLPIKPRIVCYVARNSYVLLNIALGLCRKLFGEESMVLRKGGAGFGEGYLTVPIFFEFGEVCGQ